MNVKEGRQFLVNKGKAGGWEPPASIVYFQSLRDPKARNMSPICIW
jgi:hypothetical protein